jgi:hypothetical protein
VCVNDCADDSIFCLGGDCNRVYLYSLGDGADLELRIDAGSLADFHKDAFDSASLEARRLDSDGIAARRKERGLEVPGVARGYIADDIGRDISDVNGGVRYNGPGGFCDETNDRGCALLREDRTWRAEQQGKGGDDEEGEDRNT